MNGTSFKEKVFKAFTLFSLAFFVIDLAYRSINDINYYTREKCILYRMLPKLGFLFYEYFIELLMIVVVGIYVAVLLESYFSKYRRFYPENTITAFLYASLLPVCACTAIPLIRSLKDKLRLRTVITFVVAAPLLSPYIIILSFSVIGVKYGILRIVSSFILAYFSGFVVEFFYKRESEVGLGSANACLSQAGCAACNNQGCTFQKPDIYVETYEVFKKIFPFLIIAGIIGIVLEYFAPANLLVGRIIPDNILGLVFATLVGMPIYFCNGAEVLFLRPLMHSSGFTLGTCIAFSLTSTSVCVTSFIMLIKFLGKKVALILLGYIIVVTLILGFVINLIV